MSFALRYVSSSSFVLSWNAEVADLVAQLQSPRNKYVACAAIVDRGAARH
jgi:hypothetical protein